MTFRTDPQNYDLILHTYNDEDSYNSVATLYTVPAHFVDTTNNRAHTLTVYVLQQMSRTQTLSQRLRDILVILEDTHFFPLQRVPLSISR
jgi:hypothetical protein